MSLNEIRTIIEKNYSYNTLIIHAEDYRQLSHEALSEYQSRDLSNVLGLTSVVVCNDVKPGSPLYGNVR